jgi:hypothetical protein
MKFGLHRVQEYLARLMSVTEELPPGYVVGGSEVNNNRGVLELNSQSIIFLDRTLEVVADYLRYVCVYVCMYVCMHEFVEHYCFGLNFGCCVI